MTTACKPVRLVFRSYLKSPAVAVRRLKLSVKFHEVMERLVPIGYQDSKGFHFGEPLLPVEIESGRVML